MKRERLHLSEFMWLNLGVLLLSAGVYFFKIPNGFTTGGVTAIGIVLGALWPSYAPTTLIFFINMALLLLGFVFFGKKFGAKTVYCSLAFSFELVLLEWILPLSHPLTNEPMLELIFSILLPAIGSAIIFNLSASSGGTDIVAMILRKYTSIDIGKALLLSDCLIVVAASFVLGIRTALFSILGLVGKSFMVDLVIESFHRCKFFTVITNCPEEVRAYILESLHHGATLIDAVGGYTQEDKTVILTACRPFEAVRLKAKVRELDPHAFMMITNSSEIIGRGFRGL